MAYKLFEHLCSQTLMVIAVGIVITLLLGKNAWGAIVAYWCVNSIKCALQAYREFKSFMR